MPPVATAFGIQGVLETERGPPPATTDVFGIEGVLESERGHTPDAHRHEGREAAAAHEAEAMRIARFLEEHKDDAELLPGGKVRCATTGHEMPLDMYWLESHWEGRKYAKAVKRLMKAEEYFKRVAEAEAEAGSVAAPAATKPKKYAASAAKLHLGAHATTSLLGRALARGKGRSAKPKREVMEADDLERWTMDDVAKIDLARALLSGGPPRSSSSSSRASDTSTDAAPPPSTASEASAAQVRRRNASRSKAPAGLPPAFIPLPSAIPPAAAADDDDAASAVTSAPHQGA